MVLVSVVGLFWVLAAFHGAAAMDAGDFGLERNLEVKNADPFVEEKAPPVANAPPRAKGLASESRIWNRLQVLGLFSFVFFVAHCVLRLRHTRVVEGPSEPVGELKWGVEQSGTMNHGVEGVEAVYTERTSDRGDRQTEWSIQGPFKRETVLETEYADGGRAISSEMRTGSRVEKVEKITKDNTVETKRTVTEGSRTLSVRRQAVAGSATTIEATFVDTEGETKEEYNFIVGSDGMLKSSSAVPVSVEWKVSQADAVMRDLVTGLEQKVILLGTTKKWQKTEGRFDIDEGGVKKAAVFTGIYDVVGGSFTEQWRIEGPAETEDVKFTFNVADNSTSKLLDKTFLDAERKESLVVVTTPLTQRVMRIDSNSNNEVLTTVTVEADGSTRVTYENNEIATGSGDAMELKVLPGGGLTESSLSKLEQRLLIIEGESLRGLVERLDSRIFSLRMHIPRPKYADCHRRFKEFLRGVLQGEKSDASGEAE